MYSPLKATRVKRGQTLAEVSQAVGTDSGNLSRIENGRQTASPQLAEKLAKHFGYEITEIQIVYPERFQPGAPAELHPTDSSVDALMAEAAKAGLIERRSVVRRQADRERLALDAAKGTGA